MLREEEKNRSLKMRIRSVEEEEEENGYGLIWVSPKRTLHGVVRIVQKQLRFWFDVSQFDSTFNEPITSDI